MGRPFPARQGVKQGCPQSPNLFGFFVEVVADYLEARDREESESMLAWQCPVLGDCRRLPLLFFADDMNLFSTSAARLQRALEVLDEFCEAFGMKVNARKSEVYVLYGKEDRRVRIQETSQFSLGWPRTAPAAQRVVPWRERVRYLGLYLSPKAPFASCINELEAAGRRAVFALLARLDAAHIWAPAVRVTCFEVQVRSVLSYGAELWGPDQLYDLLRLGPRRRRTTRDLFEEARLHPMVQLQKDFLKRCVGAKCPSLQLLFRELGQLPLHHFWLRQVCGFWNRLVDSAGTVYHDAFVADVKMACRKSSSDCWAAKVIAVLDALGYEWPADTQRLHERYVSHKIRLEEPLKALEERFLEPWRVHETPMDPRVFTGEGVKMCRHQNWMLAPGSVACLRYQCVSLPLHQVHAVARFRVCAWPLAVYRDTHLPREQRVCRVCKCGMMEDEYHVVFECSAYDHLREECGLSRIQGSMLRIWTDTDPYKVGAFLASVHSLRKSVLDQTAR
jgi:hypothetical protein